MPTNQSSDEIAQKIANRYDDKIAFALDLLQGGLTLADTADVVDMSIEELTDSLQADPEETRDTGRQTGEPLVDMRIESRTMYALISHLQEGDHVYAETEFTRQPNIDQVEFTFSVVEIEKIDEPIDLPRLDVTFEQIEGPDWTDNGQKWRGRFGYPGTRSDIDNGEALLYEGDNWASNTGIFHRLERVNTNNT